MLKTKDLSKSSVEQMREFLLSFDIVLSDADGVVWHLDGPIDGALESLKTLQDLGKEIYLVTNNNTVPVERYCDKMNAAGLNMSPHHIINTSKVFVWYLKKLGFRDEVYALTSKVCRQTLKEAGIKLVDDPDISNNDPRKIILEILDRPSVKAVITDFDLNCTWAHFAFAISCLKRKDVIYLTGGMDEWIMDHSKHKILGPGPLLHVVSSQSGRKPISCAKPSEVLKQYILETCKVIDPQRCLFIGDTANQDMKFADMCGFKKLLVGTGCDTLEIAQEKEETYPDYYLPSLNQLLSALKV